MKKNDNEKTPRTLISWSNHLIGKHCRSWRHSVKRTMKKMFSTREVIEMQSSFYYQQHPDLGFDTIANAYPDYAKAIGQLFARLWKKYQEKRGGTSDKAQLVELGPGTGTFARTLVSTLDELNVPYQYHLVDVNPRMTDIAVEIDAAFHHATFEHFARTWKETTDFLIANQAIDMWAGDNIILGDAGNHSRMVKWKLFNNEKNEFLEKKEARESHQSMRQLDNLFWIKYVESGKKAWRRIIPNFGKSIFDEYIKLPRSLTVLLKKVRLGGVFQDYWSFETPNPLAAGMTRNDCQLVLNAFPDNPWAPLYRHYEAMLAQDEEFRNNISLVIQGRNKQTDFSKTIAWMPAPIIPFGRVDVTHAPNIQELLSKLETLKFRPTVIPVDELIADEGDSSINISSAAWKSERFIMLYEKEWLQAISF